MSAHQIAIYGKGGIGKSTIATSLSVLFAQSGRKVLHVGCDPKRDSSLKLADGHAPPSVLEALTLHGATITPEQVVATGRHGVDFVEAGGPEAGVGCAGRGVSLMLERLDAMRLVESRAYEVVVYDVLGDVVCGGFAAPLRRGISQQVCIVTSEEPMSLFAANNIAKAVARFAPNGVTLAGLVVNARHPGNFLPALEAFAHCLGTSVLACIPHDRAVRKAEYQFRTVVETAPESLAAVQLAALHRQLIEAWEKPPSPVPTPLEPQQFVSFVREHFKEDPEHDT
jgi:nitrogenase iron protein NifH